MNAAGPEQDSFPWDPLGEGLGERGSAEGKNLIFGRRYTDGNHERLRDVADELVLLTVDVLVPRGGPATMAAKAATTTIPIAMWGTTDAIGIGAGR